MSKPRNCSKCNSRCYFYWFQLYQVLFGPVPIDQQYGSSRTKRDLSPDLPKPFLPEDLASRLRDLGFPPDSLGGVASGGIPDLGHMTQGHELDLVEHLRHGLVFRVLEENPALLLDPEVRHVLGTLLGFSGKGSETLNPVEVADVLKVLIITNPLKINAYNMLIMAKVLIIGSCRYAYKNNSNDLYEFAKQGLLS